jgi:hypothetical protein
VVDALDLELLARFDVVLPASRQETVPAVPSKSVVASAPSRSHSIAGGSLFEKAWGEGQSTEMRILLP